MDIKWKKFSQSIGVRIILNLLLIATIVIGTVLVPNIYDLKQPYYVKDGKVIEVGSSAELYDNRELQEEFNEALRDILSYVLKVNCLENNKENKEFLEEGKKNLDAKWKNYKYVISYTDEEGQENVIRNTSESAKELLEFPVAVSYEGILSDSNYKKSWRNLYKGADLEYSWLMVNNLVYDICMNNKEYSSFISNQIITHLEIYLNNIRDVIMEQSFSRDNAEIYEKLYKKKWITSKDANVFGLTNEEMNQIYDYIYSNLQSGEIDDHAYYMSIPLGTLFGTPNEYNITFAIDEEYGASLQSEYQKRYDVIVKQRKLAENLTYALFYDGVAFVLIMLALLYVCGRRSDSEEIQYLVIDRCFTEIDFLAEAILLFVFFYYLKYIWTVSINGLEQFTMNFIPMVILWLMTQIVFSLMRKIKGKRIISGSFCMFILKKTGKFVCNLLQSERLTIFSVMLATVLPVFYSLVVVMGYECIESGTQQSGALVVTGFLMCSWGGIIALVYHQTRAFMDIYKGVEKVKAGDIKHQIQIGGSGMMHRLAENINSLSDGLEDAVNEKMKSERLKTELISNVSHDIKTPLTSIITYVDLLKKEDIQPEKTKEYIEVLDQKSQRLKYLTDDLFEAAKASSGAMSIERVTLDIGSLVNQGIGEFTEKFEKANLFIKNNVKTEQYFVKADGRLLWRIFENVLSNVSKYALEGSRVYIDVEEQKETIMLTVKNISAYELNISASELLERFTRGDRSRNTEGSGLGLNIAKSLAELQNGEFYVEIDGDLFKAVLILPKVEKRE